MKKFASLIRAWEQSAAGGLAAREFRVRLPLWDAARIAALTEMYPRRSETELLSELLTAALDELEAAMPYVPGPHVVAEDEEGNPLHEDTGPTPRFLELSRKHFGSMEGATEFPRERASPFPSPEAVKAWGGPAFPREEGPRRSWPRDRPQ